MIPPEPKYKLGSSIAGVYGLEQKNKIPLPLFSCGVSAGFPSPADDYIGQQLDLNDLLIKNPAATFFVRVAGDSMTGVGINDKDILVVDRSLEPVHGRIVIAAVNSVNDHPNGATW
jgi:DNA polymerase V